MLDSGDGPELCLGGVAESWPPQCGGPPVVGWDWSAVDHERASGVRWGAFAVTGTWDGERITMTRDPIPAALYDTTPIRDPDDLVPTEPTPRLREIQDEIDQRGEEIGLLVSSPGRDRLEVEVLFDDGTIQRALDASYGAGLVRVTSALRPVG